MNKSLIIGTMLLQMKNSFARKTFQFTLLVQPILYTFITYYMFLHSAIPNYISYVVLGSGLLSLWSCIVFSSAGDIERERWMGTFINLFGSPSSFIKIMFAKIIGNTILSLLPFIISLIVVRFIFQEPFIIQHLLLFVVVLTIGIFSFVAIAFLFSAIFTLSRKAGVLMNCLEYPIFILCGLAFPITMLPSYVQSLSCLLSPTWVALLLRETIQGIDDYPSFYKAILVLIILSCIYIIFGLIMFKVMDKRVREKATLEVS